MADPVPLGLFLDITKIHLSMRQIFLVAGVASFAPRLWQVTEAGMPSQPPGVALHDGISAVFPDGSGLGLAIYQGQTDRYLKTKRLFSTAAFPLCFGNSGALFTDDGALLKQDGSVLATGFWGATTTQACADADNSIFAVQQAQNAPSTLSKFATRAGVSSWSVSSENDIVSPQLGPDANVWAALIDGTTKDWRINKYRSSDGSILASVFIQHLTVTSAYFTHTIDDNDVAGPGSNYKNDDSFVAAVTGFTVDSFGRLIVGFEPTFDGPVVGQLSDSDRSTVFVDPALDSGATRHEEWVVIPTNVNVPAKVKCLTQAGGVVWERSFVPPPIAGNYYIIRAHAFAATKHKVAFFTAATPASFPGGPVPQDSIYKLIGLDYSGRGAWSFTAVQSGVDNSINGTMPFVPTIVTATPIIRRAH